MLRSPNFKINFAQVHSKIAYISSHKPSDVTNGQFQKPISLYWKNTLGIHRINIYHVNKFWISSIIWFYLKVMSTGKYKPARSTRFVTHFFCTWFTSPRLHLWSHPGLNQTVDVESRVAPVPVSSIISLAGDHWKVSPSGRAKWTPGSWGLYPRLKSWLS